MKSEHAEIILNDEIFYLLPQKAMYRVAKNQLILSDIHLGKTTHFRKQGIALPVITISRDIEVLHYLLNTWQPTSVLILGDLFHSDYNKEWIWFKSFVLQYPQVQFFLVEGNHDILDNASYSLPNLFKMPYIEESNFIFTHKPLSATTKVNFCGHIHPGIRIEGMAKQSIKLPCFYFNGANFILPAFGYLTGLYLLNREEEASYYLVTKERVLKL